MFCYFLFFLSLLSFARTGALKLPSHFRKQVKQVVTTALLPALLSQGGSPAFAGTSSRIVAEIPTSGFVFKDKLKVEAFTDPALPGITLYLGDFERPLTEKISGDFFDDPTSSTLGCVQTGPITEKQIGSLSSSSEGEEIFSESKNLLFKSVKVRRVKDSNTGALVYSSFSSRGDKSNDKNKNRFSSSLCVIKPKAQESSL